ncbi:MAG: hypothetical protein KA369_05835 [Spirochaetes bacterium]|nr:hypothetical protein [Spirochaetota bacterium]
MREMNVDVTFNEVKNISICRLQKGYSLTINKETIELINTTNFEWRIAQGMSPTLYHMYFGNESGDKDELNFHITFNEPCYVKISNGHPRCYVHIELVQE